MLGIWEEVVGENEIKPMMATVYRLVESQEQAATLGLVNNVFEQGILEELLESTKSPLPKGTDKLHYLLTTPFRYPPLPYGSRFGTAFEPSLFYSSLNLATALAETAYYRFVYMLGPEKPFPVIISSDYTSFSVSVKSDLGVHLDQVPFFQYQSILTSPSSYVQTQQLGTSMRQNGVEMFRYISARDKNKGKNIALYTPKAFHNFKPSKLTSWLCQTSIDEVGFLSKEDDMRLMFMQKDFHIGSIFPSPAA